MSHFPALARSVRDSRRPLRSRFGAYRECLRSYSRLTHQPFASTVSRFQKILPKEQELAQTLHPFWRFLARRCFLDLEQKMIDQLLAALDVVERERNHFLRRLHHFEKRRVRQKSRGLSKPSVKEVATLYEPNYLILK